MAMIKCPECDKEISSSAYECPNCGKSMKKPERGFFGKIVMSIFVLFNLAIPLLMGFAYISSTNGDIGAGILAGIGIWALSGIWVTGFFVLGLLALLTRPSR